VRQVSFGLLLFLRMKSKKDVQLLVRNTSVNFVPLKAFYFSEKDL